MNYWEYAKEAARRYALPVARVSADGIERLLHGAAAFAGWNTESEDARKACTTLCARFTMPGGLDHGIYGGLLKGRPVLHICPMDAAHKAAAAARTAVGAIADNERAGAAPLFLHHGEMRRIPGRPSWGLMPAPEKLRDEVCRENSKWVMSVPWQLIGILNYDNPYRGPQAGVIMWGAIAAGRFFVHAVSLSGIELQNNQWRDLTKPWDVLDASGNPGATVAEMLKEGTSGPIKLGTAGQSGRAHLIGRVHEGKIQRLVGSWLNCPSRLEAMRFGAQAYPVSSIIVDGIIRYWWYDGNTGKEWIVSDELAVVRVGANYQADPPGGKESLGQGAALRLTLWKPFDGTGPMTPEDEETELGDGLPYPTPDPAPPPEPPEPDDPDNPPKPEDVPDTEASGDYKFAGENGLIVTRSITGYRVTVDHAYIRKLLFDTQINITVNGSRSYDYDRGDKIIGVTNTMYYGGGGASGRTVSINPAWSAPVWGQTPEYQHQASHALPPGSVRGVRLNRSNIPRKTLVRPGFGILARKGTDGVVYLSLDADDIRNMALNQTHAVMSSGPVSCSIERGPWSLNINITWE